MSLVPTPASATNSIAFRDYRKGNWTLQETLTLIAAKRLDDDRRSESKAPSSSSSSSQQYRRSAELRWKWIENYCCANGCLRSQNQCNDKWDNLLRDYKKVIHFNSNNRQLNSSSESSSSSYWNMDKQQRKDLSLPSNLSFEVFEALTDVLNRRSNNRRVLIPVTLIPQQPQVLQLEAAKEKVVPLPLVVPDANAIPTPPVPTMPTQQQQQQEEVPMTRPPSACESSESSEAEADETAEPDRKRRKVRGAGSGVVHGASIIARTLLACEEKRDKRHRDLVELQERRLRVEADQTEMNRQGFAGLISAVNSLCNAIHSVVSHNRRDNSQSNGNAR